MVAVPYVGARKTWRLGGWGVFPGGECREGDGGGNIRAGRTAGGLYGRGVIFKSSKWGLEGGEWGGSWGTGGSSLGPPFLHSVTQFLSPQINRHGKIIQLVLWFWVLCCIYFPRGLRLFAVCGGLGFEIPDFLCLSSVANLCLVNFLLS